MFRGKGAELLSVAILPLGIGLAVQAQPGLAPVETSVAPAAVGPVSYARQIAPLLQEACAECHGAEDPELGLDVTSYEALMKGSEYGSVVEAGDAAGSLLIDMVAAGEMPVDADPLTEEQIELLRSWIDAGAENN